MMPTWMSIAGPVLLLLNFIFQMTIAIRARKDFREDILPQALLAAGFLLILVIEIASGMSVAAKTSLAIICWCMMLGALILSVRKFKRYLKTAWWLDWKRDKTDINSPSSVATQSSESSPAK